MTQQPFAASRGDDPPSKRRWQWLISALLPAVLTLATALAYQRATADPDAAAAQHLKGLMQLEALVLGAIAIGAVLLFFWPVQLRARIAATGITVAAAILFGFEGWQLLGRYGPIEFVLLLLVTCGGFLLARGARQVELGIELALRWLLALLLYAAAGGIAGVEPELPERLQGAAMLWAGAGYFAALGVIEASGAWLALRRALAAARPGERDKDSAQRPLP